MRVLLINPWVGEIFPPPSIGYLQAILRKYGHDVVARDLDGALKDNEDYDFVGVSFHSFSVRYARQIRDHFKGHLVCGGHHPSALPDQMLSIGYDQVVIGEGENALLDITKGNNEKIIHGRKTNINDIPFPDFEGLTFGGELGIPIISSRGCPFKCSFCASANFWNHAYKMRSADNVLCEIEKRKSEGFKTWMFEDDNFTANKKRTFDICSRLDGRYLWQCASRAESLDKELCDELFRAGCRTVWLGIESLSQESLIRCNKNTTVERMINGIKSAERAGLKTVCQFIVGLPGDTLTDIEITSTLVRRHRISAGSNIAWILPGTDIYREALKRGFDNNEYLETGAPFYTYEQPMATLQKWVRMI